MPQHVCATTAFEPFPDAALERSIVDRFAEQVGRHRDCLALVDRGQRLTFGELDAWSNGVAHAIVDLVGTGAEPVALVVEQGAAYAAAVLGTLKSGRPYAPFDPADPAPRVRGAVSRSGAALVLGERATRAAATTAAGNLGVEHVDEVAPRETRPEVAVGPDSIAYVFFTSGSTGEPKGVFDSHRNVLHNVLRYTNALEIASDDRLTLLQGPAFSGCVSSQFGALLNGAASFPFRLREEGLGRAADWILRERLTIYHSVPSIFRAIAEQRPRFPAVRVVRLEGDRATSADVDVWSKRFARSCVLANGLGTTETGLARQLLLRERESSERGLLPVGYAVRDVEVELVDEQRQPVHNGEVGEIAVVGDYLALGYWNRPDLTDERFEKRIGSRVYFTGDLGRLLPDGCLEYLGRREGDLKVLGTKVEPAEVERELLLLESVSEAAVAVREGPRGDGQLVAYVVAADAKPADLPSVRAALAARLPGAMLPTALVELTSMPLGANGKVDRRALPDPPPAPSDPAVPVSDDERWLADVWCDILDVEAVGPHDDFFALGGDSLTAAQVAAEVERRRGIVLDASALAYAPTVRRLASELGGSSASAGLRVVRPDGRGQPLVLCHGFHNRDAYTYVQLARRLAGRPVWELDAPVLDGDTIDDLVDRGTRTLRAAQPRGPYLLAGHCSGAVVAHQVARRLRSAGDEVPLLVLLDISPIDFPDLIAEEARTRWKPRLHRHLARARTLPTRERVSFVARRARASLADLLDRPPPASASPCEPFPGKATLILADTTTAFYTTDPARDWRALATDGVVVSVLAGAGTHMLAEPVVDDLAAHVQELLADLP